MLVSLIAAVSEDGFIAKEEGGIPWKLPRDVGHFRDYVDGKYMLLGRRTYEEMKGWFTTQKPMVLTRDEKLFEGQDAPPPWIVSSVEEAISLAEGELVVCGGGEVFALALPLVDVCMVTRVATKLGKGIKFPGLPEAEWKILETKFYPADSQNELEIRIITLVRCSKQNPT
jgi:dihydrofolate reductase